MIFDIIKTMDDAIIINPGDHGYEYLEKTYMKILLDGFNVPERPSPRIRKYNPAKHDIFESMGIIPELHIVNARLIEEVGVSLHIIPGSCNFEVVDKDQFFIWKMSYAD